MKSKEIPNFFLPDRKRVKMQKGGPLGMGWLGFIAPEVAQFVYAALTAMVILFTWTNMESPAPLMWQRVTILSGTLALWFVYLLWPCRAIMLMRVCYLLLALNSWYPDTYEINRQFGSLDHLFAGWEQTVFGFQPAALFAERFSSKVVSELMYMGYESYYLFFVALPIVVFFRDYQQLERVTFIIFGGFFVCYVIFLLVPVTGPQYYYLAVGIEDIKAGVFPDIGCYFAETTECVTAPGWSDGLFYNLCKMAHETGERPTAAFPSSHVAIATVVMLCTMRMKVWKMLILLAVPYLFLCMATVYIQAHYAIDSIAGFFVGIGLFLLFGGWRLKTIK